MATAAKKWLGAVTKHSNSLDLEEGVFTWSDPVRIAKSLRDSAEVSRRKKARSPFQAAISMLTFYINRAAKTLDEGQKKTLQKAKVELRKLYHR